MFAGICEAYSGASAHLARAAFYRGTFALQEALHGVRTGDQEAYQDGMASYV
jgi:aminoglycoside 2''-phosphotransferase